jgi:adenylylsulfate kinase-like enzyme
VTDSPVPLLWLCGPAGVGKSTAAWQLYTELAAAGRRVGFADADQLCMCYPAPPDDPYRYEVRALNAGEVAAGYQAAGAECVIVSGVTDGRGLFPELMPQAELTACRLRADADEVVRRFTGRQQPGSDQAELIAEIRAEASDLDASDFADACVETTGVPAAGVAGLVRAACADWPGFRPGARGATAPPPAARIEDGGGRVLLVTGPPGVGKSTAGFAYYLRLAAVGRIAGYVDLRQIGFVRPDPAGLARHDLRAANLAAMWRHYRQRGAEFLVATGVIENQAAAARYTRALTSAEVTISRLRCDRTELAGRLMIRRDGGSWSEPGDQLRGRPAGELEEIARHAAALDQKGPGKPLDTSGRTPEESADLLAEATGWPADAGGARGCG